MLPKHWIKTTFRRRHAIAASQTNRWRSDCRACRLSGASARAPREYVASTHSLLSRCSVHAKARKPTQGVIVKQLSQHNRRQRQAFVGMGHVLDLFIGREKVPVTGIRVAELSER